MSIVDTSALDSKTNTCDVKLPVDATTESTSTTASSSVPPAKQFYRDIVAVRRVTNNVYLRKAMLAFEFQAVKKALNPYIFNEDSKRFSTPLEYADKAKVRSHGCDRRRYFNFFLFSGILSSLS